MDLDNYTMEKKLSDIMYSSLGYRKKNEFWRKAKPGKLQHTKGHIQCSVCLEYFDTVFIIQKNNKNYCSECEKTIM
jgi:hypothetical protein